MRRTSTRIYLFTLVTAVLVPLLAFTAFLLTRYAENERARFESDAVETARQIALIINSQLGMLAAMLQGLTSSSALARNDLPAFYAEAIRLVQGRDAVIVLRELGPRRSSIPSAYLGTSCRRQFQYRQLKPPGSKPVTA